MYRLGNAEEFSTIIESNDNVKSDISNETLKLCSESVLNLNRIALVLDL